MPASYVQTNYNSSTTAGSTSQTATLTATPSVGNTLVVAIRAASSNTVTSVTDSASNTYTLLVSKQVGSASTVYIYAAPIATAPSSVTTQGPTGSTSARPTIVAEFAGLGKALTQDPTDGTGTNGKSNGSATSDTISTAKAINNYGDMVLSAITTASTVTFVPQNLIINPSNNLALGNFLATASVGSTQSFTYNWSPASASADVIATLQPYGNLLQFTTVAH